MTAEKLRYIETAHAAGCPYDQIERFVGMGYVATVKQLDFHALARLADLPDGPEEIFFGGARGPGKTYATLAQVVDDCLRFDGLKVLFLRKVGKNAEESLDDVRRKLLRRVAHQYAKGVIRFLNGSRIIAGHYDHDSDIDAYIGIEYDVIVIEEAGTIRAKMHEAILGSLRSSKPGWRPRLYLTSNPGGVSHGYLKKRFVTPQKRGNPDPRFRFVGATVYDNPFVDDVYIGRLQRLSGFLRRAWLHGDWEVAAGQFFVNFREDVHVIKRAQVRIGRFNWISLDHGFNHPTAIVLWTKLEGVSVVVEELAFRFTAVATICAAIRAMLERYSLRIEDLDALVASPDMFAKRGEDPSVADKYAAEGLAFEPANHDRVNGAAELNGLLGDVECGIDPLLFVCESCVLTIEQLQNAVHDPKRPEDVLKVDITDDGEGGDDLYDTNRYAAMKGAELGAAVAGGYAQTSVTTPGYTPR